MIQKLGVTNFRVKVSVTYPSQRLRYCGSSHRSNRRYFRKIPKSQLKLQKLKIWQKQFCFWRKKTVYPNEQELCFFWKKNIFLFFEKKCLFFSNCFFFQNFPNFSAHKIFVKFCCCVFSKNNFQKKQFFSKQIRNIFFSKKQSSCLRFKMAG